MPPLLNGSAPISLIVLILCTQAASVQRLSRNMVLFERKAAVPIERQGKYGRAASTSINSGIEHVCT